METYPYFDAASQRLAFDAMLAALEKIPDGDVVCCTAVATTRPALIPTPEQWDGDRGRAAATELLPLVDFAYQGFAEGIAEDAAGVCTLVIGSARC